LAKHSGYKSKKPIVY